MVFLLILAPVLAEGENLHHLTSLTLKQDISNSVSIIPKEANYDVDYFQVWLYLFAQNDAMQSVLAQQSNPSFSLEDDALLFSWDNVKDKELSFGLSQTIKVQITPTVVTKKISFPLDDIPLDIIQYTIHTNHIDSSPEISQLAGSLAQGEDDLFLLEHKIADWVNKNIEYNLSTITSEANIPSSIVLDQRYGVCDEITNLFISINRELGVPARFVSGIAYSESILFSEPWGNHGWAEVYFPNVGWVPYDVTYEQFSTIDPTHIALQKGVDGNSHSVEYKTSGYNYEFKQDDLDMSTEIVDEGSKRSSDINIELSFYSDEIDFGSYNLITAKVTNKRPYYISERVALIPTTNSETLTHSVYRIALKPKETKTLYWIVQVSDDLQPGYYYTFPMAVIDSLSYRTEKTFRVDQATNFVEYKDIVNFVEEKNNNALEFSCFGPKEVLVNSNITITCDINSITKNEYPINFCINDTCLDISSKTSLSFNLKSEELGIKTYKISGVGKTLSGSSFVTVRSVDVPKVNISEIMFPQSIDSDDKATLSFRISKISIANPKNLSVQVIHPLFNESWEKDILLNEQQYSLTIPGNLLMFGTNKLIIAYSFVDDSGQVISGNTTTNITLSKIKGADNIIITLNTIDYKINNIFNKKNDGSTTVISVIILGIILSLVLTVIQKFLRLLFKRK